jgi:uncharacterized membrane protein YczE/cytidylate kinase
VHSIRKPANVVLFLIGLFIMALGVSVSVRADLGVTPISCVPYVYSLNMGFTLGELTIFFNVFLIAAQIIVARKRYSWFQLIQLPAVVLLGYFIDFTLSLVSFIDPSGYPEQMAWLLTSCLLLAVGVFCLVKADITYFPGDGLVAVISDLYKRDFGKTKMCLDSSMVVIGLASSFMLMGRLAGIREGTVIAALLVGFLIRQCNRLWNAAVARRRGRADVAAEAVQGVYGSFPVITISREYGSGGHEIGQRLAKTLGYSFYDKELIDLTAEQSGFDKAYVRDNEQKIANTLFHELFAQNYAYAADRLPPTDTLFLIQSKIIRDVCAKGPCVIVGRCANFILKDNPNSFNVFIHANDEYRRDKIVNHYHAAPSFSSRDLERADHERANYCLEYTGENWRDATNYHVTVDSSLYSTEETADRIIECFRAAGPRLQQAA